MPNQIHAASAPATTGPGQRRTWLPLVVATVLFVAGACSGEQSSDAATGQDVPTAIETSTAEVVATEVSEPTATAVPTTESTATIAATATAEPTATAAPATPETATPETATPEPEQADSNEQPTPDTSNDETNAGGSTVGDDADGGDGNLDEATGSAPSNESDTDGSDTDGSGAGSATVTADGAAVYAGSCADCHAADGSGGRGPDITTIGQFFPEDDAPLVNLVANGGTVMPGFSSRLNPDEIDAVVDYIVATFNAVP